MLVENLEEIESSYYKSKNIFVIPSLLTTYYENKNYELVYYFSLIYEKQFEIAYFYKLMSSFELGYYELAEKTYNEFSEDWFNICKQNSIYWKHVALFSLYFNTLEISEFYTNLFDSYYDDSLIQLIDLIKKESSENVLKTTEYLITKQKYPSLTKFADFLKTKNSKNKKYLKNLKWDNWIKYNNDLDNQYYNDMILVYEKDSIRVYSYRPKSITPSMHIITDGNFTIMLDCGCEIRESDVIRLPIEDLLKSINVNKIDKVYISHAHLDHYGSMNSIRNADIIMTSTTKSLIHIMSPEIIFDNIKILEPYASVIESSVKVTFIPNGHIRGSVAIDIDWKGFARIVYTGDFSLEDQKTVSGLNLENITLLSDKKIDLLMIESTYGNKKDMLNSSFYEILLLELCEKYTHFGNKIIIPSFAIGRAQEVALILNKLIEKSNFRILIDGLAAKITEFYQLNMGYNILNSNISVYSNDQDYLVKIMNNDIIIASSGMLKEGSTSWRYLTKTIAMDNTCIFKVGFINSDEHLLMSIKNRIDKNINFIDIPLSAHASYNSLIRTVEFTDPECLVFVHGKGIVVD